MMMMMMMKWLASAEPTVAVVTAAEAGSVSAVTSTCNTYQHCAKQNKLAKIPSSD